MSLDKLRRETEWHCKAACRPSVCTVPSECFIPPVGDGTHRTHGAQMMARALKVCEACPVRGECGADAKRNHIRYGVWGGQIQGLGIESLTRWGPWLRVESREPYVA